MLLGYRWWPDHTTLAQLPLWVVFGLFSIGFTLSRIGEWRSTGNGSGRTSWNQLEDTAMRWTGPKADGMRLMKGRLGEPYSLSVHKSWRHLSDGIFLETWPWRTSVTWLKDTRLRWIYSGEVRGHCWTCIVLSYPLIKVSSKQSRDNQLNVSAPGDPRAEAMKALDISAPDDSGDRDNKKFSKVRSNTQVLSVPKWHL